MKSDSKREASACEAFQHRLRTRLEAGQDIEDLYDDPHSRSCDPCRVLLDDFEKIKEAMDRRIHPYNRPN